MNIYIQNLVPTPLKDKPALRQSETWYRSLTLQPGQLVKIKAPSGTGKTTFVHIVYGLRNDYEGTVHLGEVSMRKATPAQRSALRQQHVSIVFQDLRLFAHLTARENIELKRVLTTPWCQASAIDTMAEQLGIGHILHQKAGICSYGEQQRIAIARALVQPFTWLLMDEPFSHLDHDNTRRAAALIAEACRQRGAGLLLTDLEDDTHFNYTHHYTM